MSANSNTEPNQTAEKMLEQAGVFSKRLTSTSDVEKLYRFCTQFPKDIFHFDCSSLFLLDEKQKNLILRATLGLPRELVNSLALEENQGLPGFVVKVGEVGTVEEYPFEGHFETVSYPLNQKFISAIAAPMFLHNKIIGVFIGETVKKRLFTEGEKQLYQMMANQAAVALNGAMLTERLKNIESKKKQKGKELQKEKKKNREITSEFESIFTTITTGVMLLKNGRHISRCNEKMADIFGYDSARQLKDKSALHLHLSEDNYHDFGEKYYDSLSAGEIIQTDYMLKKKDGRPILCSLSGRAVDQSPKPNLDKGFVWLIDDITRRKKMEEEILQARKLESISILAGGIGHDYNNLLSVILGNLGLAQRILEPEHNVQDLLTSALEASTKAKELTAKLLLFTQRDNPTLACVKLPDLFKDFRFEKILRNQVDLTVDFQQGLFMVKILPDHLKVILQNLLLNADGCMPEGGKITVTGYNVEVLEEDTPGLSNGKYIEITVADNGSGIEQDILENIFDPYFTTKNRDSSKGIGLGLAIVHSIVKKNNGTISVKTGDNGGTVFTVLLPAYISGIQPFNK